VQSFPPYAGAGLVQVRFLDWFPPPQLTEQVSHAAHSDSAPSTARHDLATALQAAESPDFSQTMTSHDSSKLLLRKLPKRKRV